MPATMGGTSVATAAAGVFAVAASPVSCNIACSSNAGLRRQRQSPLSSRLTRSPCPISSRKGSELRRNVNNAPASRRASTVVRNALPPLEEEKELTWGRSEAKSIEELASRLADLSDRLQKVSVKAGLVATAGAAGAAVGMATAAQASEYCPPCVPESLISALTAAAAAAPVAAVLAPVAEETAKSAAATVTAAAVTAAVVSTEVEPIMAMAIAQEVAQTASALDPSEVPTSSPTPTETASSETVLPSAIDSVATSSTYEQADVPTSVDITEVAVAPPPPPIEAVVADIPAAFETASPTEMPIVVAEVPEAAATETTLDEVFSIADLPPSPSTAIEAGIPKEAAAETPLDEVFNIADLPPSPSTAVEAGIVEEAAVETPLDEVFNIADLLSSAPSTAIETEIPSLPTPAAAVEAASEVAQAPPPPVAFNEVATLADTFADMPAIMDVPAQFDPVTAAEGFVGGTMLVSNMLMTLSDDLTATVDAPVEEATSAASSAVEVATSSALEEYRRLTSKTVGTPPGGIDNPLPSLDEIKANLNSFLDTFKKTAGSLTDVKPTAPLEAAKAGLDNTLSTATQAVDSSLGAAKAQVDSVLKSAQATVNGTVESGISTAGSALGTAGTGLSQWANQLAGHAYDALHSLPPTYQPLVKAIDASASGLSAASAALAEASRFGAQYYQGADEETQVVLLILGALAVTVPTSVLYQVIKGGYAGDLSPEKALKLLQSSNTLLIDVRNEDEKDGGVPNLVRQARNKYKSVEFERLDKDTRKLVKDPLVTELRILGATIAGLRAADGNVVIMDQKGEIAKQIARAAQAAGVRRAYRLSGGYQNWEASGLPVRPNEELSPLDVLREEAALIAEEALAKAKEDPLGTLKAGLIPIGGVAGAAIFYYNWQRILEYSLGAGIVVLLVYNAVKKVTSYGSAQELGDDITKLIRAPIVNKPASSGNGVTSEVSQVASSAVEPATVAAPAPSAAEELPMLVSASRMEPPSSKPQEL